MIKELTSFGSRKDSKDGHDYICRPCKAALTKQWQDKNRERYLEYNREYNDTNRKVINDKARQKYKNDPKYFKQIQSKHRKANLDKHLARAMVYEAIKKGTLIKPKECLNCGKNAILHAHHCNGYDKDNWYNVSFLCSSCHGLEHRKKLW